MVFEDSPNQPAGSPTNADATGPADLALVRSVLTGDPSATERFLDRMRLIPRAIQSLSKRAGAPLEQDVLNDVSQEVFARVWTALPTFKGLATLETWVFRFCMLTLLDHQRSMRVALREDFDRIAGELVEEASSALSLHDAAILHEAMARLLPEEAEIVEARHFCSMSFDQAAAALATSQGTLKTRYYRAMARLRTWLRKAFHDSDRDEPRRGSDVV